MVNRTEDAEDREPATATANEPNPPKRPPQPYANIVDTLDDSELSQSGAIKLLVSRLKVLEYENAEFADVERKYHDADKRVAVLEKQLEKKKLVDALESTLFSSGFLLIGASISLFTDELAKYGLVALALGGVLAIAAAVLQGKR